VTWLRAFGEVVRSGLTIEETRLEPLLALRTAAGVAIVVGPALWLVSPAYAASAALGAYSAGGATFQRTWRPRKVIALGAGAGLALSTFVGYLAAGRLPPTADREQQDQRGLHHAPIRPAVGGTSLVIGSLNEFTDGGAANPEEITSFEQYRRSIQDVEVITFDELYQRVCFIVEDR
jgi:hypothetical protein